VLTHQMGNFVSDYWTSLAATITLLSGTVALVIDKFFKDRRLAGFVSVAVFILFGLVSVLGAFYSQHANRAAGEAETARRAEISAELSNLIDRGDKLMDELVANQQPLPLSSEKEWNDAVEDLVPKLGHPYVTRLHNITGIVPPKMSGMDWPHFSEWGMIYIRVARLEEFLREFSGAGGPTPSAS
jgi:hypothetical protein